MAKYFLLLVGLPLCCVGHLSVWLGLFNLLNGVGWPRKLVKPLSVVLLLVTLALPPACLWIVWSLQPPQPLWILASIYSGVVAGVGLVWFPRWVAKRRSITPPALLREHRGDVVDIHARLGKKPISGWKAHLLSALPGNQVMELEINHKSLALRGLPARLEGLKILHLSDLHFANRLTADFYQELVLLANQLAPDMVCVTGDIVDKKKCLPWLKKLLGQLTHRYGAYYVLGNHDLRVGNVQAIHQELGELGWTHLGSRWRMILVEGEELLIAGNERPWLGTHPDFSHAPPTQRDGGPFRLLLTHTPDMIGWANDHNFDLVLAGHTHGGQVHLPVVGPIVSPSLHGVKYSSGTFQVQDAVLHVSQGSASYFPLRMGCRSEITLLHLLPEPNENTPSPTNRSSAKRASG